MVEATIGDAGVLERARAVVGQLGAAFCRGEAQDGCATCQAAIQVVAAALRAEIAQDRVQFVELLQSIVRLDETYYEHHQARRWDGKQPQGGSIWRTPRELASNALRYLGATVPDPIAEMREESTHG